MDTSAIIEANLTPLGFSLVLGIALAAACARCSTPRAAPTGEAGG